MVQYSPCCHLRSVYTDTLTLKQDGISAGSVSSSGDSLMTKRLYAAITFIISFGNLQLEWHLTLFKVVICSLSFAFSAFWEGDFHMMTNSNNSKSDSWISILILSEQECHCYHARRVPEDVELVYCEVSASVLRECPLWNTGGWGVVQ